MPNIKRLFLFALVLTLFCGGYVLLAPGQTAVPHESWRLELGEVLGSVAVWLLVILYGRTLLKKIQLPGPRTTVHGHFNWHLRPL